MGALSIFGELLLNTIVRTCSVAVPRASMKDDSENSEPAGDLPLGDLCPGAVFFACHPSNLKDSEREATHHMVTGLQQEIPYCSPGNSSRKQKKAFSTSQLQFRSENSHATIEADQILLALQQLATNSNSANFNNIISGISKLIKFLTLTIPTFDGRSEEFELFEGLFETSLECHNQIAEEDRINYIHSFKRGDALQ